MATDLDLQEQEQLDALKAFWNKHGNWITWLLVALLGAYAAWNGWQYWQREQAMKAAGLYEELDKAATAGDADKATQAFADLKSRYPATAWAEQGALLAAKVQLEKGKADAAKASLAWAIDNAKQTEYRAIARLRLAGVQMDAKQWDEALKTLDGVTGDGFVPLAADRRGDVLSAQGKLDEAKSAYQKAWAGLGEKVDYRVVVDAKLTALGAAPAASAAASAAAAPTPAASGAAK